MFGLNAIQRGHSTPVDRRSLHDTSVLFRRRTMDKSSPDEQRGCDASDHQILPKGSHGIVETLESTIADIDAAIRCLNENFDRCRRTIVDLTRQLNNLDVWMLRLFSYRRKWLTSLHAAKNFRRNIIEMKLRGLDKNPKKSNHPDGPVMSASEAKEIGDRLDRFTNVIIADMIANAKLKTEVQSFKIDRINKRETLYELAADFARQRRLANDIRNTLMMIKNRMKDEN